MARTLGYPLRRFIVLSAIAVGAISASEAKTSPSIAITLSAPKDTVEGGGPLKVDIAIMNISGHPITLRNAGPSDFLFDVDLSDGKHAKIWKYYWEQTGKRRPKEDIKDIDRDTTRGNFAMPNIEMVPIAPRQVIKYAGVVMDNMYDVSDPGQYVIQLGMMDPVTHAIVESNKVTVTVTK